MVLGPSLVTLLAAAVSDASRSAGSALPSSGPSNPPSGKSPAAASGSAIQLFPLGSPLPPASAAGSLMYVVGGTKISVMPTGLCMVIVPRERAKSNSPVSVNDTVMPCDWVEIVAAIRAV